MFITLEGIEGSGKTSLLKALEKKLQSKGFKVCTTREPGGSSLGQKIRPLLLSLKEEKLSARAELLLFLADRAEHVEKVILPAIERKEVVLCDRYIHSTLAYQGYARGLDKDFLKSAIDFACINTMPDMTIVLDLDVHIGLTRAKGRNENLKSDEGKFEAEEKNFHEKVRKGFLDMAEKEEKMKVVDATLAPCEIEQIVWKILVEHFKL